MAQSFPVYEHGSKVLCAYCKLEISGPFQASGFAPGRGAWRGQCTGQNGCGSVTYFDRPTETSTAPDPIKLEALRRLRQAELNSDERSRAELEAQYGQCWDTAEMQKDFSVEGFTAPYVVVRRKADGKRGSLEFRHSPRLYFNWVSYEE